MRIPFILFYLLIYNLMFGQNPDSSNLKDNGQHSVVSNCSDGFSVDSLGFTVDTLAEFRNRASVCFGIIQTKMFNQGFYGLSFEFYKHFFRNRLSVGLGFFETQSRTPIDSFQFVITKPKLEFGEFYFVSQYSMTPKKYFRINYNINTGYSASSLSDSAIIVSKDKGQTPKKIASNNLFIVEPGISCSLRLFNIRMSNTGFWLTVKTNYRYAFGKCEFGTLNQYKGFIYWVGLTGTYTLF